VIAPMLTPPPSPTSSSRERSARTAREATRRRKSLQTVRRYRACVRIGAILTVLVSLVVGYLYLITRTTALDDRLLAAQSEHARLQEELVTLDDRRATLESRDRLFQLAGRIGLHEPSAFLIVDVPTSGHHEGTNSPFMTRIQHLIPWLAR